MISRERLMRAVLYAGMLEKRVGIYERYYRDRERTFNELVRIVHDIPPGKKEVVIIRPSMKIFIGKGYVEVIEPVPEKIQGRQFEAFYIGACCLDDFDAWRQLRVSNPTAKEI